MREHPALMIAEIRQLSFSAYANRAANSFYPLSLWPVLSLELKHRRVFFNSIFIQAFSDSMTREHPVCADKFVIFEVSMSQERPSSASLRTQDYCLPTA